MPQIEFEYKYFAFDDEVGSIIWEEGEHRKRKIKDVDDEIHEVWRTDESSDVHIHAASHETDHEHKGHTGYFIVSFFHSFQSLGSELIDCDCVCTHFCGVFINNCTLFLLLFFF